MNTKQRQYYMQVGLFTWIQVWPWILNIKLIIQSPAPAQHVQHFHSLRVTWHDVTSEVFGHWGIENNSTEEEEEKHEEDETPL